MKGETLNAVHGAFVVQPRRGLGASLWEWAREEVLPANENVGRAAGFPVLRSLASPCAQTATGGRKIKLTSIVSRTRTDNREKENGDSGTQRLGYYCDPPIAVGREPR